MNKSNVWSLADAADADGLRRAIANAPSCVNVCGWSYAAGRRRGIAKANVATSAPPSDSDADETESSTTKATPAENKKQQPPAWSIAVQDSHPATILHYAAVRGSTACVVAAFEAGASATIPCNTGAPGETVTADVIADECGFPDVAEMIRLEGKRQENQLEQTEENEEAARRKLELEEEFCRKNLQEPFADGVVDVELVLRDVVATIRKTITVPRYISFKTFRGKVEEVMEQRVLLSYKSKVATDSGNVSGMNSTMNSTAGSPTATLNGTMNSSNYNSTYNGNNSTFNNTMNDTMTSKPKVKNTELHAKTIGAFLQRKKPVCTVRPLIPCSTPMHLVEEAAREAYPDLQPTESVGTSPKSKKKDGINDDEVDRESSPSKTKKKPKHDKSDEKVAAVAGLNESVHQKQKELNDLVDNLSKIERGPSRLEKMKKLLDDTQEEADRKGTSAPSGAKRPKTITPDNLDQTLLRLYQRPLDKMKKSREDYNETCREGQQKLYKSHKQFGDLTEDEEASIDKLYSQDVERKLAAIATVEERVQEQVPVAKQSTLTEEESEAARKRLFASDEARQRAIKKLDEKIYGKYEERKVVSDMAGHLDSVYTGAVQKKKDAKKKVESVAGDFRTRKQPSKKLTREEADAVGTRLATKN